MPADASRLVLKANGPAVVHPGSSSSGTRYEQFVTVDGHLQVMDPVTVVPLVGHGLRDHFCTFGLVTTAKTRSN